SVVIDNTHMPVQIEPAPPLHLIASQHHHPTTTYTLSLHDALPLCAEGDPRPRHADDRRLRGRQVADPGSRRFARERGARCADRRSEEHTSELQSLRHLVCRLLLEKKKYETVRMRVLHCARSGVLCD